MYEIIEKEVIQVKVLYKFTCNLCGQSIVSEYKNYPMGWRGRELYGPDNKSLGKKHLCPDCITMFIEP